MATVEKWGGWARLIQEAADRYWTAADWAALTPERQALALATMDDGDVFTQAGIVAAAEERPVWTVINDWTAAGLLGPLFHRRAA